MRNQWEEGGRPDLDEPATITERQLRSLRRGARVGVLAILLALVSVVAAAWSLLMGPDALAGIEGVQDVKQKVLSAIGQTAPAESQPAQALAPQPDNTLAPGAIPAPSTPESTASQVSAPSTR